MKCPWCAGLINNVSDKCAVCDHAFNEGLQDKIATVLRLEKNQVYLTDIANRTQKSASALAKEIIVLERQASRDALELDASESDFLDAAETGLMPEQGFSLDAEAPDTPEPAMATPAPEARPVDNPKPSPATPGADEWVTAPRSDGSNIEEDLGKKWLPIIGVVTVIFGVGYFLKYAMDQGWINPIQRIMAAYLWGVAFHVTGHFLRKRDYEGYGLTVMGGGLATWYFSTFAAHNLYGLIGQTPAFAVMFIITLAAGVLSVYHRNMWIAVLGLFGGYFTPLMLSTGANNYAFLFTYLGILSVGILGIAYWRRWPVLHYLGFIATYILFGLWYITHFSQSPFWPAMVAITVYFLAFAIVPFAYRFFRADEAEGDMMEQTDVFMIITNSFIAFAFSYSMITLRFSSEAASIASLFYSASFCAMAWIIYEQTRNKPAAFGVFAANSGLFFAIAIGLLVSRQWVALFWAIQAAGLFRVAMRIEERGMLRNGAIVLMVLAYCKVFSDYGILGFDYGRWAFTYSYTHELASRALLATGILGSLVTMALTLRKYGAAIGNTGHKEDSQLRTAVLWGSGVMLFFLLNAETGGFFHDYLPKARFASISVLWTAFSTALMLLGFRYQQAGLRKLSIWLFMATLLKVFFADISRIDTPYRILSFIVLGTVLVGVSYLYHRFHDRLSEALAAPAEEETERLS